jgi:hypothetical protein
VESAKLHRPPGGLVLWIFAPLLPVVPIFWLPPTPAACYWYQSADPATRTWEILLILMVGAASLAVIAPSARCLVRLFRLKISRAGMRLAIAALVVAPLVLALVGNGHSALSSAIGDVLFSGALLCGFALFGVLLAWLAHWSTRETDVTLSLYLLCAGVFGYPSLLLFNLDVRGGVFC